MAVVRFNPVTTTTGAVAQSASETASDVTVTTIGVPNGGFETGDFTHWNGANQIQGSGDWFVYEGTESPLSYGSIRLIYAEFSPPESSQNPDGSNMAPIASDTRVHRASSIPSMTRE